MTTGIVDVVVPDGNPGPADMNLGPAWGMNDDGNRRCGGPGWESGTSGTTPDDEQQQILDLLGVRL
ncbi:MAG: hypothetical protein ACUVXJ_16120, partial [Phycisphaerae bacterium]